MFWLFLSLKGKIVKVMYISWFNNLYIRIWANEYWWSFFWNNWIPSHIILLEIAFNTSEIYGNHWQMIINYICKYSHILYLFNKQNLIFSHPESHFLKEIFAYSLSALLHLFSSNNCYYSMQEKKEIR